MRRWLWAGIAFVAALYLTRVAASFLTDRWWFDSVGYGAIFARQLWFEVGAGLVGGVTALVMVGGSAQIATRARRVGRMRAERLDPMRAATMLVTALVAGATALSAAQSWPLLALAVHGGAFGSAEGVYGHDVGFYVFVLPLILRAATGVFWLAVAGLAVTVANYIGSGTVRVQLVQQDGQLVATGVVMPREVKRHVALSCAAILVLYGVLSFLGRYGALSTSEGLSGPGYADLYAGLPMSWLLSLGSVAAAVGAVVAVGRGSWMGLAGAFGSVAALRLGAAVVPAIVQRLVVEPSELSLERPQVEQHLAATRAAWGLDRAVVRPLDGEPRLDALAAEAVSTRDVPLWDEPSLLAALGPDQGLERFYRFASADAARYVVDGEPRRVWVAPRELDVAGLSPDARGWVHETMTYTHGYGVVVAAAGDEGDVRRPSLLLQDIPLRGPESLRILRPEIYFGELGEGPVLVATRNEELDHPLGDDERYTSYAGRDGVRVGGIASRFLFAVRLGSHQILLSSDLTAASRVLLYRDVRARAERIAPMFRYDSDPELVIDDGRLVWLLDAYTTSERYPYAAHVAGLGSYARASVKVSIDAYEGTVRFYRAPVDDPIADAWERALPGLMEPLARMPASLSGHLRYPRDLFAAQATLLQRYHVADAQVFHREEDRWQIPAAGGAPVAPVAVLVALPEASAPELALTLPYGRDGEPGLAAWVAGRADGQLALFTYPKDRAPYGPTEAAEHFGRLALNEQSRWGGGTAVLGPLIALPVGEGMVYTQVLSASKGDGSRPDRKRVLVAIDDRAAVASSLQEALRDLFPRPDPPPEPTLAGSAVPAVTTVELVRRARLHWNAADAAARAGDWAAFGVQMRALGEAMEQLESVSGP
jgi:uncharacterized protein